MKNKLVYILIVSFLLTCSFIYFIMNYKNNIEDNEFLKNITTQQQNIYNIIYDEFKTLSNVTYNSKNIKQNSSQLLYQLLKNSHLENKTREQLYKNNYEKYTELLNYGLNDIHFHTPKGKSFLRMKNKKNYGEDISIERKMISWVDKNKKHISGFESGIFNTGYRYIFPLFYKNLFVGSVEFTFKPSTISKKFMDSYNLLANFVMNKKTESVYIQNENEKYVDSHLEGYYVNKNSLNDIEKKDKLRKLSNSTIEYINQNLNKQKNFSVLDNENNIIVTVLKIRNPIDNNINAAFIIRTPANYIINKNINLKILFFTFSILVGIVYYFIYLQFKNRSVLEHKVKKAVFKIKHQEKKLMQKAKSAEMGEMIDSIAHQWKQPIGVIKMRIEMIKLNFELNNKIDQDEIKEHIQKANQQIDHLVNTIDEFRDFFNPDSKTQDLSLEDLVHSCLILVKDEMIKNNIICCVDIDKSINIKINKNETLHIILNIMHNAKDAFSENNIDTKKLKFNGFYQNNKAVLTICDNAGGVPKEIIDKIFNSRFTTKTKNKGSGVGLYMSKQIALKNNIELSVSNYKKGACFKLKFN